MPNLLYASAQTLLKNNEVSKQIISQFLPLKPHYAQMSGRG